MATPKRYNRREVYMSPTTSDKNVATDFYLSNLSSYIKTDDNILNKKEQMVHELDINDIDDERIKNDDELKSFVRPVHRYYSEEETTHDDFDDEDDDDYDIYEEEEALVNNPLEELRRRTLYTQTSVSTDNTYDGEVSDIAATTRTLSEVCPYFLAKTIETTLFVLFMLYWIIKEPIIRIATFITMIVSSIFIAPLAYIWSKTSRFMPLWVQQLAPRANLHRRAIIGAFVFACLSSLIYNHFDYVSSYIKQSRDSISLPPLNDPHLADINGYFTNINKKLDAYARDLKIHAQSIQELKSDQGLLRQVLEKNTHDLKKSLDKSTSDHQSALKNALDKSSIEYQTALKSALATADKDMDTKIKDAIHSILPKVLFVKTDENGRLSLPAEVIELIKDKLSWDNFLKFNDQATRQFLQADFSDFLQDQIKDGAVVSKEVFLELLDKDILEKRVDNNIVDMIQAAINQYHQDVINSPDYAAEKRGALIIPSFTSSSYDHDSTFWRRALFGVLGFQDGPFHGPEMALDPQIHVGSCWCMMSNSGTLGIQLSRPIVITNFTIEHPSREVLVDDITSAPKDMELWGITTSTKIDRKDVMRLPETGYLGNGKLLAKVRFDVKKNTLQTFQTESVDTVFESVILSIKSNWGNDKYTDIYRIRVHGFPSQ